MCVCVCVCHCVYSPLIPINPSVCYQHRQDYQPCPVEEVREDNGHKSLIPWVCVCTCVYACMQMLVCRSVHFLLSQLSTCVPGYVHSICIHIHSCVHVSVCVCECVCWLESRLYGLADYRGLCKRSLSVYSALFVGGICRRQTAIDQTSQGEQWTEPCLSMV